MSGEWRPRYDKNISAPHDVAFKALFVRNPYLLKGFLSDTLDLGLTNDDYIQILNPEMVPDKVDGKMNRLDLRVQTPNRKYNVEMQAQKNGFSPDRVLHYWSRLYVADIQSGESYRRLETTYSVNVLGFEYFDCDSCYSSFSILENKRRELFTDKLSIHIFELPKVSRETSLSSRALDWLKAIQADSEETLKTISDNTENPTVRQAAGAILELNADEKLRQRIIDQQNALFDYNNDMTESREEGRAEGLATGLAEGLATGLAKGVIKEKKSTAEKLVRKGWSIEEIAEFLDVSAVDVEIWLNAKRA